MGCSTKLLEGWQQGCGADWLSTDLTTLAERQAAEQSQPQSQPFPGTDNGSDNTPATGLGCTTSTQPQYAIRRTPTTAMPCTFCTLAWPCKLPCPALAGMPCLAWHCGPRRRNSQHTDKGGKQRSSHSSRHHICWRVQAPSRHLQAMQPVCCMQRLKCARRHSLAPELIRSSSKTGQKHPQKPGGRELKPATSTEPEVTIPPGQHALDDCQ